MIDITGLDKYAVLAALHNGTRAQGLGKLRDLGRDITVDEVKKDFENGQSPDYPLRPMNFYVDYYHGRPIKADLSGNSFEEQNYDRDTNTGNARRVIDALRTQLGIKEEALKRDLRGSAKVGDEGEVMSISDTGAPTVLFDKTGTATVVAPTEIKLIP